MASELWTAEAEPEQAEGRASKATGSPARRIRRPRNLPGSRAVVGALLVTAAAVGVFAAYLDATATPDDEWVVVQREIPAGTLLTREFLEDTDNFAPVPIDLPPDARSGAVPSVTGIVERLEGRVTTVALGAEQLLTESVLRDLGDVEGAASLSFPIESSRAVAGTLSSGDLVDVVATFESAGTAETRFVARGVEVLDTGDESGGLAGNAGFVITLALPEDEDVLAVAEALDTGKVFVVRAALTEDGLARSDAAADAPPADGEAPEEEPSDAPADEGAQGEAPAEDADAEEPPADDAEGDGAADDGDGS